MIYINQILKFTGFEEYDNSLENYSGNFITLYFNMENTDEYITFKIHLSRKNSHLLTDGTLKIGEHYKLAVHNQLFKFLSGNQSSVLVYESSMLQKVVCSLKTNSNKLTATSTSFIRGERKMYTNYLTFFQLEENKRIDLYQKNKNFKVFFDVKELFFSITVNHKGGYTFWLDYVNTDPNHIPKQQVLETTNYKNESSKNILDLYDSYLSNNPKEESIMMSEEEIISALDYLEKLEESRPDDYFEYEKSHIDSADTISDITTSSIKNKEDCAIQGFTITDEELDDLFNGD